MDQDLLGPAKGSVQQRLERDLALLATMQFRCADPECGRYGLAGDGGWTVVKLGDGVLTYCVTCSTPGGGS